MVGDTQTADNTPFHNLTRTENHATTHVAFLPSPIFSTPFDVNSFSPLPVPLTALIGREQICSVLCAKLAQPTVRLVTLTGIGGIGKTRVSLEVASLVQERFYDGVCFVPLVTINQPDMVLSQIAQALRIHIHENYEPLTQIITFLQTKNVLLVLDNFEHVIDASAYIRHILVACPGVKIIITSRIVLHIEGELEFSVPPLALADQEYTHEEPLIQSAAVQLFIERARAVQPNFQPDNVQIRMISEICFHLDGLPLAIELAAARSKLFPLPALLRRLPQRFELLTNTTITCHPRHQTLQNTLKWSYDLLTPQEQYLFCQLSVFNREAPLEGIQFLITRNTPTPIGETEIINLVSSLLDKSFLQQIEQEDGEPRFAMLETVQAYGRRLLQTSGGKEAAQRAHALYYIQLLEHARTFLYEKQQLLWLKHIRRELENIRTALNWTLEVEEISLLVRLCASLSHFWLLWSDRNEGCYWVQIALEKAASLEKDANFIQLLSYAGELAYYRDEYQDAAHWLQSCITLSETVNSKTTQVHALTILAMVTYFQGFPEQTQTLFKQSEELFVALNAPWEHAFFLRLKGLVAWYQGDLVTATSATQEGLLLARAVGERSLIARLLSTRSGIATRQNDLQLAESLSREIVTLAYELDDMALLATTLQNLGYVAGRRKDFTRAHAMLEQALACFRKLGDMMFLSIVLHSLGYIMVQQKNYAEATTAFEEGLQIAVDLSNDVRSAWHLLGLAEVAAQQQRYARAARLLAAANQRFDIYLHLNEDEQAEYARLAQNIQTALGANTFQSFWSEGEAMKLPDILGALDSPSQTSPGTASKNTRAKAGELPPADLTNREYEILKLVAQGLSDAQIAEQLVVSPRTVNWHLGHIYKKIQVTSRSAATRFLFEQRT